MSALFFWKCCGEFRRFAKTVISPWKTTNKYCGDLRRRRIRAETAQKISKSWLVGFPTSKGGFVKGGIRISTGRISHLFRAFHSLAFHLRCIRKVTSTASHCIRRLVRLFSAADNPARSPETRCSWTWGGCASFGRHPLPAPA